MNHRNPVPKPEIPKPGNPLSEVKRLITKGEWYLDGLAPQTTWFDFGWDLEAVKKCLLKLNDRFFGHDPDKNHFYKSEDQRDIPGAKMDYYKACNIMDGENVYIHLYIDPASNKVVINSFKRL